MSAAEPATGCRSTCSGCSTPPSTCRCGTACRRPTATARRSAVLILFGEGPRGPDVLLIEKSAHLRSHAGQPAFPGGGVDPGDDSPSGRRCARPRRRPGIDPAGVRVLATLQELYLPPSDRLVVPVVGWWDDPRDVTVGDPREVARVARVPLADLVDPANRFRVRHPAGYIGPAFAVADMLVWGFTAGLLEAILEAAGTGQPWDERDVRPLPARRAPYTLPGRWTTTRTTPPRRRSPTPHPTALRRVRFRPR